MKRKGLSQQMGSAQEEAEIKPQLTSLIDVMTILLVFLIQNFSSEGQLVTASDNLTLPMSSIQTNPEMMVTVSITTDAVLVGGEKIVDLSVFAEESEYIIPELLEAMEREQSKSLSPTMMLQADKELPFNIIKRVAFTCNRAGFSDFSILVFQEGQ